ncbi:MAG: FtsQ-type POTRA domain-containing protein [Streptococcaceae bacterium]|jgi:cell division protein FtsQ|nr:FtsQ-type POTRA domain-containing protein [Streptococcaceae bacterium]
MDEENKEKNQDKNQDKNLTPWQVEHQKYMEEKGEKPSWQTDEPEEEEELEVSLEEENEELDEAEPEQEEKEVERRSVAYDLPKMKKNRNKKMVRRLILITTISLVAILLMTYQVSPLSKLNNIQVQGKNITTTQAIIESSKLRANQSIWSQFFNRSKYEKNIVENNIRVKEASISWSGINNFDIKVLEYNVEGYEVEGNQFFPILANGAILKNEPVNDETRNKALPVLENFKGATTQIENLFAALLELPKDMHDKITRIKLAPRDSNPDLVRLFMNDGNIVVVSIEDMVDKLDYYHSVVTQLPEPQVIDMEVGIFAYPLDQIDKPIQKVEIPQANTDTTQITDEGQ